MTAITDVCIATGEGSTITTMELLEEFADSTPTWSFLEDDTHFYAETRGCPACILSHIQYQPYETIDYAFAAAREPVDDQVHLVLVEAKDGGQELAAEDRDRFVRDFVSALEVYAAAGNIPVEVSV